MVTTYRGRVRIQNDTCTFVEGNLYVCLELAGSTNEPDVVSGIVLTESERKAIPAPIADLVSRIGEKLRIPLDWEGDGISTNSYPHISIRNYERAIQDPEYSSGYPQNWSSSDLISATVLGSSIGLEFYDAIMNAKSSELPRITLSMWESVRRACCGDSDMLLYVLHIAAHTIPRLCVSRGKDKMSAGFVDKLIIS